MSNELSRPNRFCRRIAGIKRDFHNHCCSINSFTSCCLPREEHAAWTVDDPAQRSLRLATVQTRGQWLTTFVTIVIISTPPSPPPPLPLPENCLDARLWGSRTGTARIGGWPLLRTAWKVGCRPTTLRCSDRFLGWIGSASELLKFVCSPSSITFLFFFVRVMKSGGGFL